MHLVRKSEKYLFHDFFIFFILVWIILSSLEILSVENFIHGKFYLVQRILSIKNLIKSGAQTFIQCVDFYPVQRLLSSVETFIQCVDFYPVRRRLSSVETFIQCRDFFQGVDFYPVHRLLSSAQTFIQLVDFYPVHRLLSSVETFIQCIDFYPVHRLLSSAQTCIQCRDFYQVHRLFFLTKWRKIADIETIIQDFKNYNCNQIIVKEY